MFTYRAIVGSLVLALVGPSFAQGKPATVVAVNMKPGIWEIATSIETSESKTRRVVTSRLCYTNEDTASPARVLPPQRGVAMKCQIQDLKVPDPTNMTWHTTCAAKDANFIGTGSLKAQGSHYAAQVSLESRVGSKVAKIDEKTAGHWVEACR